MGGGGPYPIFFCANLLVRVKLGYPPNFNFLGKPLLGEKYGHGKKEERRRKKKNNAKFSGHYVLTNLSMEVQHDLYSDSSESELVVGKMVRSESGLPFASPHSSLDNTKPLLWI